MRPMLISLICWLLISSPALSADISISFTAENLITKALESWRGKSSFSQTEMTIHRPDWQRTTTLEGWTQGMDKSIIRFIQPAKDAGNATLKLNNEMWLFTPRLNRVTKLPASMMSQSWMGSDFSYNDLAKSDQILTHYTAKITHQFKSEPKDPLTIYQIELLPKINAPVVWGKEVLLIREDGLLLSEVFYDQNFNRVKTLYCLQMSLVDQKAFPIKMRMQQNNKQDHWTEITTTQVWLDLTPPSNVFSQTFLKSPQPWQPKQPSDLTQPIIRLQPIEVQL